MACYASPVGEKIRHVGGFLKVRLGPRVAVLRKTVGYLPLAAITFGHVVIACSAKQ